MYEFIDDLKKRDCVYVKADKGNALVVLNKVDYFTGMDSHIEESPYIQLKKNPLLKLERTTKEIIKVAANF